MVYYLYLIIYRSEQLQARVGTIKSKTDNFNPVVDISE